MPYIRFLSSINIRPNTKNAHPFNTYDKTIALLVVI